MARSQRSSSSPKKAYNMRNTVSYGDGSTTSGDTTSTSAERRRWTSPPRGTVKKYKEQPQSLLRTFKARRATSYGKHQSKHSQSPTEVHEDGNLYYSYEDDFANPRQHLATQQHQVASNSNPASQDPTTSIHKDGEERWKFQLDQDNDEEEGQFYIVKQSYGYCAIAFSIVQVVVFTILMVKCGVAPMSVNVMIGPTPDVLSYWGGKNSYLIVENHEYWRLLTPLFLHGGVLHILGNVAVQLDAGAFFEREWGSVTWLVIYLASAIGSSIASCIVMTDQISVGSSGGIMGLFGAKLSEIICRYCERNDTPQSKVAHEVRSEQLWIVLLTLLVVGIVSLVPYVDWGAHLGGLLTGMTLGLAMFSCSVSSMCFRLLCFVVGAGATVAGFVFGLQYLFDGEHVNPAEDLKDICEYYRQVYNDEDHVCRCQSWTMQGFLKAE